MEDSGHDTLLRQAAFDRVRTLCEIHDHLTAQQLSEGFFADGIHPSEQGYADWAAAMMDYFNQTYQWKNPTA